MLKKINAVLGLIAFVTNTIHCFISSLSIIVPSVTSPAPLALTTNILVILHVIISVLVLVLGGNKRGAEPMNKFEARGIMIKRITGFVALIFIVMHALVHLGFVQSLPAVGLPMALLFILILEMHIAPAAAAALITLGIVKKEKEKIHRTMMVSYTLAGVMAIFALITTIIEFARILA